MIVLSMRFQGIHHPRCTPRLGHLDRVKRVYGYLSKTKDAMIHVRTPEPGCSGLPEQAFVWAQTVYGDVSETG